MRMTLTPLPLLALLLLLPGCIVQEIRDEMRGANQRLDATNSRLVTVESNLDRTNTLIDDVQKGLSRLDTTNTSLDSVQTQMQTLQAIQTSLSHLDTHLASLRKTIGKLDSAIPFLDLGGDAPLEPSPDPAAPAAAADPAAPGTAPTNSPTSAPTSDKRDPITGTWLLTFPTAGSALILNADATALDSTVTLRSGTWARAGATLTLTYPPTPGATNLPTPTEPARPATTPTVLTYTILNHTSRALTLRSGESILVYRRP